MAEASSRNLESKRWRIEVKYEFDQDFVSSRSWVLMNRERIAPSLCDKNK